MRDDGRRAIGIMLLLLAGCGGGTHEGPGEITSARPPAAVITARAAAQQAASPAPAPKQILFGDLHVHTTFSADAFLRSLPILQGEGAHPPADACDFARFCSGLDFWSINDHAETLSPQHWAETKESIRQCNALAGDPANPDMVSFLGWEWTQVGTTPATHYGHKNVILHDTADDRVPTRPISALNEQLVGALRRRPPLWQRLQFPVLDWRNRERYFDFAVFQQELVKTPLCPEGVDVHDLPADCSESAQTPAALFEKLSQWGFDTIVIPHGNTWGFYTPPGSSWDKQLVGAQHDPARQTLIEVYSGHGNSEEYRDWRDVTWDDAGNPVCAAPTKEYLPCCWQAGELIRTQCADAPAAECERRVAKARTDFLRAGAAGRRTVPWAGSEAWLDCGYCRNCFLPAFNYRPQSSSQYALAISNFDDPAAPRRFRFGFIASSDNHSARPGTGYKEYGRRRMTEVAGARDAAWHARLMAPAGEPRPESVPFDMSAPLDDDGPQAFQLLDMERQASFFMTGGLVAVHATGRDRDAIWSALKRREVYATSGPRLLLWFDLLNGPNGPAPMGSALALSAAPRLHVRAVGAFKQKPGCPEWAGAALGAERLEYLCRGECYHPSDERHRITRIEIVRIRPQTTKGEPVGTLIDDPWRTIACPDGAASCEGDVTDPDFVAGGREVIYYARAVQEPTPAVNAAALRCEYDAQGNCTKVNPCWGDYRTPYDDDCLAPAEERAWSSPIYVRPEAS
ncbi:MAG TPA: DUF3604 domain-containing protein [Candidatus Binatia bacterium]|jgi:hypothetical protein|nr:DUF3604 domain-containing protein [Candidatus Binatia bacterium]